MTVKKLVLTIFLFILLTGLFGCGPKFIKTEMDNLFENNFSNLDIPEIDTIQTDGKSKQYPYATFDEVWESSIVVFMQQGFIVRSLKDSGFLVVIPPQQQQYKGRKFFYTGPPPLVIYVEEGEAVTVYLDAIKNLYRRIDKPEKNLAEFTPEDMNSIAETFFGQLATQLYAGQKWGYLHRGTTVTEDEQQEVSVDEGAEEEVSRKETPESQGMLTITSYPSGARIFIDGEYKGQTPAEISLATGTYQFFLQHQSYESYMDSVTIEKDQTQTLNIRLSPEGKE